RARPPGRERLIGRRPAEKAPCRLCRRLPHAGRFHTQDERPAVQDGHSAVPAAAETLMKPPILLNPFSTMAALHQLFSNAARSRATEAFLNPASPYIINCRIRPAMAINGHRNKLIGPGGSTRRLHPRDQVAA